MRRIIQQLDSTVIIERGNKRRVYLRPGSASYRQPSKAAHIFRPTFSSEERLHNLLMNQRTHWRSYSYGNLFVVKMECSIGWATFK